jgi:DNA-binding cell septation regulator SpoVG
MQITEIQIEFVKPNNGLVGFASLVVDGNIYLSSIAIHKKLNLPGYRLTYPSKGRFAIFHPIHKEASNQIEQAIFAKLKDVMNKVHRDVQEIQP